MGACICGHVDDEHSASGECQAKAFKGAPNDKGRCICAAFEEMDDDDG